MKEELDKFRPMWPALPEDIAKISNTIWQGNNFFPVVTKQGEKELIKAWITNISKVSVVKDERLIGGIHRYWIYVSEAYAAKFSCYQDNHRKLPGLIPIWVKEENLFLPTEFPEGTFKHWRIHFG